MIPLLFENAMKRSGIYMKINCLLAYNKTSVSKKQGYHCNDTLAFF